MPIIKDIKVNVNIENLDEYIEKVNQLKTLLQEVQSLVHSLGIKI